MNGGHFESTLTPNDGNRPSQRSSCFSIPVLHTTECQSEELSRRHRLCEEFPSKIELYIRRAPTAMDERCLSWECCRSDRSMPNGSMKKSIEQED